MKKSNNDIPLAWENNLKISSHCYKTRYIQKQLFFPESASTVVFNTECIWVNRLRKKKEVKKEYLIKFFSAHFFRLKTYNNSDFSLAFSIPATSMQKWTGGFVMYSMQV